MGLFSSVVSAVTGVGGAIAASKEAKKSRKETKAENERRANAFTNIDVRGPGGSGVTFGGNAPGGLAAGGVDFNSLANLGTQGPQSFNPAVQPTGAPGGAGSQVQDAFSNLQGGFAGGFEGSQGQVQPRPTNNFQHAQDVGSINLNLGDLDPAAAGLRQGATQNVGRAGQAFDPNAQLNQNFANFNQAAGNFGTSFEGGFDSLLQGAGQAFGNAQVGVNQQATNPFQQGLQNSLLGQAQGSFDALPGTQQAARDQQLALLRQEAQPFEDRAFANLQDNQFATGRLGSTGGALQTEAFARGLGQADLSRQLQAGQEGRSAQGAQLGLAQGQLGAGSDIRQMQDQLLSNATNRFGALGALSSNIGQARFNQGQQAASAQFGRAQSQLQNTFAPQMLQQALQSGFLNNAGAQFGQNQVLNDNAIGQANLGLNAMQAQANARTGNPSQPLPSNNSLSTGLSQLSGAFAPAGGGGAIQDIFSSFNNRAPQSLTPFTPTPIEFGNAQPPPGFGNQP